MSMNDPTIPHTVLAAALAKRAAERAENAMEAAKAAREEAHATQKAVAVIKQGPQGPQGPVGPAGAPSSSRRSLRAGMERVSGGDRVDLVHLRVEVGPCVSHQPGRLHRAGACLCDEFCPCLPSSLRPSTSPTGQRVMKRLDLRRRHTDHAPPTRHHAPSVHARRTLQADVVGVQFIVAVDLTHSGEQPVALGVVVWVTHPSPPSRPIGASRQPHHPPRHAAGAGAHPPTCSVASPHGCRGTDAAHSQLS